MTSIPIVRFYQQSFETHPYRTLAFTNGALNGLGDVVAAAKPATGRPARGRPADGTEGGHSDEAAQADAKSPS